MAARKATTLNTLTCDILFAGGGLASSLAAYRIAQTRPDVRLCIVERGKTLGGNHTWSFHDTDVLPDQRRWIDPFITAQWPRQEVRFPRRHRVLDIGYNSIHSDRLHEVAGAKLGASVLTDATIAELKPDGAVLSDGRTISAGCVIDGRGQQRTGALILGFQKFVGREVRTTRPHGVDTPVIMDATVAQTDGYRFVYVLPFAPDRLMIEDTYYSDGHDLDADAVGGRIEDYAAAHDWSIAETVREERGVLPIALGGDIDAFWRDAPADIARIGLRAALFHPTTGYSLPDAVAVADALAARRTFNGPEIAADIRRHSVKRWRDRAFFRMLNRMLYYAADPGKRYRVLERFYGLPADLTGRFYADRLTLMDKARILVGKPPVPIGRAIRALPSGAARQPATARAAAGR